MGICHALLCCWAIVASQGTPTKEPQLVEPMPMAALAVILKEIGFQPTFDVNGDLTSLTKEERVVESSAWTTGTGREDVLALDLRRRYFSHRTLDGSFLYDWVTSDTMRREIVVCQQLDRSVWMSKTIVLAHGLTKERLKFELEALWETLNDAEGNLLGPDWRVLSRDEVATIQTPPDPNTKVFHLSDHDIAYLIRSWNWTFKGSHGGSGPTVTTPAVIGGVTYWFCRPHPGYPVWDHLAVFTEFAMPKTDDLQGWIDKMNAKLNGPKLDGYPGGPNMLIVLDLDLAPGMTLAKLKTSIERFAKQAAPFVRGDFSKAPTRTN